LQATFQQDGFEGITCGRFRKRDLKLNHDVIAVRDNLYFQEYACNVGSVMDGNDD